MSGEETASGQQTTPWIAGELRIAKAVMDDIDAHAIECFPSECCGFVIGPADDAGWLDENVREVNEADKYHKLDPERFPRTSEMYFKINELRAARAMESGAAAGRPLKVIYHSHPNAGAYFSPEDAATFAIEGQLMWPCAFIVVSVFEGEIRDRKLWVHTPGTNAFEESTLEIT